MEYTLITFDYTHSTNQEWKDLIREHLHSAKSFEIHCWTEEPELIELALQYGEIKETDWAYGKVVSGEVTPEFVALILNQPKPTDTEIYNKMTPFFSISLDNGFFSSHYGTEVYLA